MGGKIDRVMIRSKHTHTHTQVHEQREVDGTTPISPLYSDGLLGR